MSAPGSFAGLSAVHVRQLTQAEAVGAGGVREAVDGDGRAVRLHLEALAHLLVQLEVGDRTPEVGRCKQTPQNTHDVSHVYERNLQ